MWLSNIPYEKLETISEPDLQPLKIIALGDGMVGKTCLIITFKRNAFPLVYVPTVFANHYRKLTVDGMNYNLLLWDTAGQEEYNSLRPLSYPNTKCFLLCYSIANRTSYDNVFSKWSPEIRHFSPNVPVILVGTKSDLRIPNSENFLTTLEGEELKGKIRANAFVECSAKKKENIQNVFQAAIRAINKKPHFKTNFCRIL